MNDSFYQTMCSLKLNQLPIWGISKGTSKVPLNAKAAYHLNFNPELFSPYGGDSFWGAGCKDPDTELCTLDQLYQVIGPQSQPAIDYWHWINTHANVYQTHVLLLDIENTFDQSWVPYLNQLPVGYFERSIHQGWHMIVPVSDEILSNPAYTNLWDHSTIKVGQLKNTKHTGIEIKIHSTWLTFTHQQIVTAKLPTQQAQQGLINFLDHVKAAMKTLKKHANINNSVFKSKTPPTNALLLKDRALTKSQKRKLFRYAQKTYQENHKTNDQSEPDWSECEYKILNQIAHYYYYNASHGFTIPLQKNDLDPTNNNHPSLDPTTVGWIIYLIGPEFMKPREKWHRTYQNGQLDYLQYVIQRYIVNTANFADSS